MTSASPLAFHQQAVAGAGESFFLSSDAQGRFGREFLGDAFPLILGRRPSGEIRVAGRDIVGFDAEPCVGRLLHKQHCPGFGFRSIASGVFVRQPPDLPLGQIDGSGN